MQSAAWMWKMSLQSLLRSVICESDNKYCDILHFLGEGGGVSIRLWLPLKRTITKKNYLFPIFSPSKSTHDLRDSNAFDLSSSLALLISCSQLPCHQHVHFLIITTHLYLFPYQMMTRFSFDRSTEVLWKTNLGKKDTMTERQWDSKTERQKYEKTIKRNQNASRWVPMNWDELKMN